MKDMILLLILTGVALVIAGIGKAIMDTLQFHFSVSVFKNLGTWWDPRTSWTNKYKNHDPSQGEAFPGSTTIFVFVTDAWHFFQFIFLRFIFAAMILLMLSNGLSLLGGIPIWLGCIIAYVALSAIFGLIFTLFYKWVLK